MVLVAAFGGLHLLNETRLRSVQAALTVLRSGDESRQRMQSRLDGLSGEKTRLDHRAQLVSLLDDDAPMDAVLAEITRLMTESMRISSLLVKTDPPAFDSGAAASHNPNAPGLPAVPDPVLARGPTRVTLLGLAASDVEVGVFFGKLSASPLFADLTLAYSRQADGPGTRGLRQFELSFRVRRVVVNAPAGVATPKAGT
jgi:hypothetical protein